ncbi:MAG: transposase [Thiohalocapsa sp.]
MYDRGYERAVILELFRIIDWMIPLLKALEVAFRQELYRFEEGRQMPYVTTVERAGIEKDLRQGEAQLLPWQIKKKFGAESAQASRPRVEAAESETLRT